MLFQLETFSTSTPRAAQVDQPNDLSPIPGTSSHLSCLQFRAQCPWSQHRPERSSLSTAVLLMTRAAFSALSSARLPWLSTLSLPNFTLFILFWSLGVDLHRNSGQKLRHCLNAVLIWKWPPSNKLVHCFWHKFHWSLQAQKGAARFLVRMQIERCLAHFLMGS